MEEFSPLLSAGFHTKTLEETRYICVDNFQQSTKRVEIWDKFNAFINILSGFGLTFDAWLDGSFLTDKPEPGDIDLVLIINPTQINTLTIEQQNFIDHMFGKQSRMCKHHYLCDAYLVYIHANGEIDFNENAYWRGLFGFDRQNKPKGIIKIQFGNQNEC